MPDHSDDTETWLARLAADTATTANDSRDLRAIGEALQVVEAARGTLSTAISVARANGRSWTEVASVLGVSRQAARQRFGETQSTDPVATWAALLTALDHYSENVPSYASPRRTAACGWSWPSPTYSAPTLARALAKSPFVKRGTEADRVEAWLRNQTVDAD